MSDEPTGEWAKAMSKAKAVDPRNGRPSWNQLAEIAEVSTSTITAMVSGGRATSATTIRKVAGALGVSPEEVSRWLGRSRPVSDPYEPPAEADLLTPRQRKALTELIRAFVSDEQDEGGGEGDAGGTPAKTPPGSGPDRLPLLAVASGDEGDEKLAREATEQARKSRQEQLDAIEEMKRKQERKRGKGGDGR
ncbi:helix-turn-helix domain-containing protein [Nocardioides sp. BYT-33-1]|uniref:helix-turn-helix domain-containing protein n=1 Tax=Nocardioides sp. BYT-33-1 TaxID=3416952 RepID=UPI003F53BCAC